MNDGGEPTEEELRSFTSWKLEIMDALTFDNRLKPSERVIAIRIVQHVNSISRLAWPSNERIGAQCDFHPDTVSKVTSKLARLGWLEKRKAWNPKARRTTCEYLVRPSETMISGIRDQVELRLEDAADKAAEKAQKEADRRAGVIDRVDRQVSTQPDRVDQPTHDRADQMDRDRVDRQVSVTPDSELPKRNTSFSQGSEGSESSVYGDEERRTANGR